jgi:hypothetical protein
MTTRKCCRCNEFAETSLVRELEPCYCLICVDCLLALEASRGPTKLFCICGSHVKAHNYAPNRTTQKRKFDEAKSIHVPHFWEDDPPVSPDQEHHVGGDEQSMGEEGTSDDQDESQERPRPAWDGIKRYLDHLYDLPPRDLKEFMGKGLVVTAQVIVTNDDEFTLDVQELSTSCVSVYGDMDAPIRRGH